MKKTIALLLSLSLLCTVFAFQVSAATDASAGYVVTDDGSGDWIVVDDSLGV